MDALTKNCGFVHFDRAIIREFDDIDLDKQSLKFVPLAIPPSHNAVYGNKPAPPSAPPPAPPPAIAMTQAPIRPLPPWKRGPKAMGPLLHQLRPRGLKRKRGATIRAATTTPAPPRPAPAMTPAPTTDANAMSASLMMKCITENGGMTMSELFKLDASIHDELARRLACRSVDVHDL